MLAARIADRHVPVAVTIDARSMADRAIAIGVHRSTGVNVGLAGLAALLCHIGLRIDRAIGGHDELRSQQRVIIVTRLRDQERLVLGDRQHARGVQDVAAKFRMRQVDDAVAPDDRRRSFIGLLDAHPLAKNTVELLRHRSPPAGLASNPTKQNKKRASLLPRSRSVSELRSRLRLARGSTDRPEF